MEVASLKQVPSFFLFIDLVKAYDCVSRAGLWLILEKKGVSTEVHSGSQELLHW